MRNFECIKQGLCFKLFKEHFKKGLTLIELLIVIAILGLLVIGLMATLNPFEQVKKSNDANRKASLAQIQKGLESYYNDNGRYPASSSNYKIFDGSKEITPNSQWDDYFKKFPADPTGKNYAYYSPDGQSYYLYASLDRKNDPQACSKTGTCSSITAAGLPANICGGTCNFGVSSPNVSVNDAVAIPTAAPIPPTSSQPTQTPIPTSTPAPTVPPVWTSTPVPPTPTRTPTPIPPTPTRTPTPAPPTPTRTPTPVPPTAAPTTVPPTPTRTPTPVPPTPTRTPTPLPISYIQSVSTTAFSNNVGTVTLNNVRAGDLLVAVLAYDLSSSNANQDLVSDSTGNTWTQIGTKLGPYGAQSRYYMSMWYCQNAAPGTHVITSRIPVTPYDMSFAVSEYDGISTTNALDKTMSTVNTTATTTANSGTTSTTSTANELLVAGMGSDSETDYSTFTPTNGFTVRKSVTNCYNNDCMGLSDKIVSTTGTYNATFTTNSTQKGTRIATFRGEGSVAGISTEPREDPGPSSQKCDLGKKIIDQFADISQYPAIIDLIHLRQVYGLPYLLTKILLSCSN